MTAPPDLEAFRAEARAWLDESFPKSLAGRGGALMGAEFIDAEGDLATWARRLGEKGWGTPTWPAEYGGGGLSQLEATQRQVIRLMHRTVLEQVAELVLDEADRYGEVRLSQTSLANLLGASRQSVNQALSELREAGGIETGYRVVRLVDRGSLESITNR